MSCRGRVSEEPVVAILWKRFFLKETIEEEECVSSGNSFKTVSAYIKMQPIFWTDL